MDKIVGKVVEKCGFLVYNWFSTNAITVHYTIISEWAEDGLSKELVKKVVLH